MDICKSYFDFTVMTFCGFPKITLTGTKQDWIKIYNKTKILLKTKVESNFGEKWGKSLLPILERFIIAFDGKIDCLFWNSMIKRGAKQGSGGWEWYSGWINVFFPIIEEKENEFCQAYESSCDYIQSGLKKAGDGNDINKYPHGLSSAPVKWKYGDVTFKLQFISGFLGVKPEYQNENENKNKNKNKNEEVTLTPMIGWIIGEKSKENEQTIKDMQATVNNMKNTIEPK